MATSIISNRAVPLSRIESDERERIASAVAAAAEELKPDVVRIRYDLSEDWSGDAAIFFRVLLRDDASRERLRRVAARVVKILLKHVRPDEQGLQAYFNYRNVSEQASLREPSWV